MIVFCIRSLEADIINFQQSNSTPAAAVAALSENHDRLRGDAVDDIRGGGEEECASCLVRLTFLSPLRRGLDGLDCWRKGALK